MRCGGDVYKPDFMMKINTFLEQLSVHISNPLSRSFECQHVTLFYIKEIIKDNSITLLKNNIVLLGRFFLRYILAIRIAFI